MVGDVHRGQDLQQETFARLFDKRKSYEPTGRFSTYLWRIAINICRDELRRVNRRQELFPRVEVEDLAMGVEDHPADEATPDLQVVQNEEGQIVRGALMQLPEIYRTVLVLRHYERMKLSKIAEILEIPLGTVNSRMAEGLVRLTRLLEPQLREPHSASRSNQRQEHLVL
jgi:RNA polymerase sigma-70 factor (ECF subfamily)